MALKTVNVVFGADTKGFQKGLKTVEGGITKLKGGLASLAKGTLALVGVTAGLKAIGDSWKAYVGLESNVMRVNSLFGESAKYISYFAQNTAKGFGIAESSAYEYAAVYGNLFRSITANSEENSKVTIAMLKSSAVVASKTGRTMEDVMERIRSGLLGNTEAIEDLGINVNVAMLEMTDAFKKIANGRSWNQLNFYEQQQVRTLAILEQANKNFGDEVQKGSAYSLSVLSGAFKDLTSTAGVFINKALQPIVGWLTQIVQWATAGLKALASMFGISVTGDISNISTGFSTGADSAEDLEEGLDGVEKSAKKAKKALAGFDELNILSKNTVNNSNNSSSSGSSGGNSSVFDSINMPEFGEVNGPDLTWIENAKIALEPTITSFKNLWVAMSPFKTFIAQGAIDFYNNFLVPVGSWVLGEGIPRFVDALTIGFTSVDWGYLSEGLNTLFNALTPFATNVGEGLLWFWENILVPIGTYAVNDLLPLFLDSMTSAVTALDNILQTANPTIRWIYDNALVPLGEWLGNDIVPLFFEWFKSALEIFESIVKVSQPTIIWMWENLLIPIAQWTGGKFQSLLEGITNAFKNFSDWAKNNQSTMDTLFASVLGFFAGVWIYNSTKKLIDFCIELGSAFKKLATGISVAGMSSLFANVGFGMLVGSIMAIATNWDKMNGIEKTISILGAIAIAAASAAAAVGALQSAWSLGVAAAAIVGGISAIYLSIKSANKDVEKELSSLESPEIKAPKFEIPKFAKGGVVDSPTIAMFGEAGTEAVMPLENNTGWMDVLAEKLTARIGNLQYAGADGNITIPVYIGNELIENVIVKARDKRKSKTNGRW